jgi:hypothetical protein
MKCIVNDDLVLSRWLEGPLSASMAGPAGCQHAPGLFRACGWIPAMSRVPSADLAR